MYRGHLSRAALGMTRARSRSRNIHPERGGCTKHYGGRALGISLSLGDHDRCVATWRAWQKYHMGRGPAYGEVKGNGWADIAYTAGYCQHGYSFAGRGLGIRTAANGTNDGNDRHYAFVFIGGGGDIPSNDALDALDHLVQQAREQGAGGQFLNHSDHKNTGCPGRWLKRYRLGWRHTGVVVPPPKKPPVKKPKTGEGDIVPSDFKSISRGSKGGEVKIAQGLLLAHGFRTFSGYEPDGDFGPRTDAAALAFCKKKGLVSKDYQGPISVGVKVMRALNTA